MGETENSKYSLFKNVKYKTSGAVSDKIIDLLKNNGAEGLNYFSDYVTHCIVGDDPSECDLIDANELYEVPAVSCKWVTLSTKCKKLLPVTGFAYTDNQLFSGVNCCLSQISRADSKAIWAMVTYNGGKCSLTFTSNTTHLIVGKPTGVKYEKAVANSSVKVHCVTPDWVLESIKGRTRCSEVSYHPRLLIEKQQAPRKLAGLSTAHITGFVDDKEPSKNNEAGPTLSNQLLEQLKQRMPWNQPPPTAVTSATQQTQPQKQFQIQQHQLLQQQKQQELSLQQQAKTRPQQLTVQDGQSQQQYVNSNGVTAPNILSLQPNQQSQDQPILPHAHAHPTKPQTHPVQPQAQPYQQIRPLPQQQHLNHQRATRTRGGVAGRGRGSQRQVIQMDTQTHAQLQLMHPQRRAAFLQEIQKQRQLVFQKQAQQQHYQETRQHPQRQTPQVMQNSPNVADVGTVIGARRLQGTSANLSLPAELSSQQQLQSVQHCHNQQILFHQNQQLQHQVLLQQQQRLPPPQQQPPPQTMRQQAARTISMLNPGMMLPSQQQHVLAPNSGIHQQTVVMEQPSCPNTVSWQESQMAANQIAQFNLMQQNLQHQHLQQLKRQQVQQQQPIHPHKTPQYYKTRDGFGSNCLIPAPPPIVSSMQTPGIHQHPGIDSETGIEEQNDLFSEFLQDMLFLEGSLSEQLQHQAQHQPPVLAPLPPNSVATPSLDIGAPTISSVRNVPRHHNIHVAIEGVTDAKTPILQDVFQLKGTESGQHQVERSAPAPLPPNHHGTSTLNVATSQHRSLSSVGNVPTTHNTHVPVKRVAKAKTPIFQDVFSFEGIESGQIQHEAQHSVPASFPLDQAAVMPTASPPLNITVSQGTRLSGVGNIPTTHNTHVPVKRVAKAKTPILQDMFSFEGIESGQIQHEAQHSVPASLPLDQAAATPSASPPLNITVSQCTTLNSVENVPTPHNNHVVEEVAGSKTPYNQAADRVAAVLAKSGAATPARSPQCYPHFFGHNHNQNLPPGMCLLGCIFFIVEYDRIGYDINLWRRIITENGGDTEDCYSGRATHILCQTQRHPFVQQGLKDGKRCVTADWLSDTILKQQVLPPWLAVHFPTFFSDEKPCRNLIISYSGFEGVEKVRVKKMICGVGAKMTSYYSSHNHILVCRTSDGDKYKMAQKWGKSVVNVQWLNLIWFGHYSCLYHPDSYEYQQFNIWNPFAVDYALIPHLMAAWKTPINITQESYDKVKSSLLKSQSRKRPRLSSLVTPDPDQENREMLDVSVTNPNPPAVDKRPIVVFSGVENVTEVQKKVWQLGGIVTQNCCEATHLVVTKPQRTFKLLCCISIVKYIVTLDWLLDSHKKNTFLHEEQYGIANSELEYTFEFSLSTVLKKPERNKLFRGKTFYITPGVIPSPTFLRQIIELAGGNVEKKRKSLKKIKECAPYTYLIVTTTNDFHLVSDVLRADIGVYSSEFVMCAVLRQNIDYDITLNVLIKSNELT